MHRLLPYRKLFAGLSFGNKVLTCVAREITRDEFVDFVHQVRFFNVFVSYRSTCINECVCPFLSYVRTFYLLEVGGGPEHTNGQCFVHRRAAQIRFFFRYLEGSIDFVVTSCDESRTVSNSLRPLTRRRKSSLFWIYYVCARINRHLLQNSGSCWEGTGSNQGKRLDFFIFLPLKSNFKMAAIENLGKITPNTVLGRHNTFFKKRGTPKKP